MITSLVIRNGVDNFSSSLALDDLVYPLTKFDYHPEMGGATVNKQQNPGRWPTQKFSNNFPIIMEGRIIAATDTTDYWVKRKALMNKAFHAPDNTLYEPIKIELVIDGDGETYYAFCTLASVAGALDVAIGAPTISEFQLQFDCAAGYWKKSSSGDLVII